MGCPPRHSATRRDLSVQGFSNLGSSCGGGSALTCGSERAEGRVLAKESAGVACDEVPARGRHSVGAHNHPRIAQRTESV